MSSGDYQGLIKPGFSFLAPFRVVGPEYTNAEDASARTSTSSRRFHATSEESLGCFIQEADVTPLHAPA
jgi:hypothetical protein